MENKKRIFKRSITLLLALSLIMSILSLGVYAIDTNPVAQSVSMNETRSYITIHFDKDIEALSPASFNGKIKLSRKGGSLSTLPSNTTISASGACLYITLTSPLNDANNFFRISQGTFSGQTKDVDTPIFDARGPELEETNPVVLDKNENTVTIKFKTGISGYPNDKSLKNGYISLARNGSSFNEIIPEDDITIDNDKGEVKIYLEDFISGTKSKFRFAAGKLRNSRGNINLTEITTPYINSSTTSASPEIDRTTLDADRSVITIYFSERIKNGFTTGVSSSLASSLLKSHILLSRGSTSKYETLGGEDTISLGSNYIRISLRNPLTASRNYVKIEGGSLSDYYGNIIMSDMSTEDISNGTSASASPEFASAFLSSSRRIVIYFTLPVQKVSTLTSTELRSHISIARNGSNFETLSSNDNVTFSDNMMTINLREDLSGSRNKVRVTANTVSSKTGVPLKTSFTTGYLDAGMNTGDSDYDYDYDESAPEFTKVSYDSSSQRARIYFNCDIKKVSTANLQNNITISRNGGSYTSLSSSDVITISPSNAITILLSEPLSGTRNAFKIAGNTLSNYDSGYVQNSTITTDYVSVSESGSSGSDSSTGTSSDYSGDVYTSLSSDLYTVTLKFNQPIYNNKSSLEDLKEKIQISRNGYFSTLTADDYIRLDSAKNELLMVLAKPADNYFSQIKILSGALADASGAAINKTITTLPLGEAGGDARTYINNSVVSGMASLQPSGNNAIVSISGLAQFNAYSSNIELLVKIPDSYNSATLNISGDIVEYIKRYGSTIALSLGNTTYYLPTSNIASITTGDTLSITIDNSTSQATQNLTSSASGNLFTIEAPAKAVSAKVISSVGSTTKISHKAFANKRFMLKTPSSNKTAFTVVRIEKSGNVVPVPTVSNTESGVIYLNAKTRSDGDYAAISSSRTLNTVTWSQAPTNILASRLILTNASGSNINGNEAINRSETVTIMSRTLGILFDSEGASPFFDMISTDNYFNAVMSTVSYDLISGYPDSTFKPGNKLTRAEAMTIVARAMRFMQGKNVSVSAEMSIDEATSILSKFTDAGTVDSWAKVNIAECVQAGVVNGDNNGRLNPNANVTRAELIQLMYNVLKNANML